MLLENLVQRILVGNIELVKGRAFPANQLNAVHGDLGRVVEAVDNDDIVAVFEEGEGSEGPNVSGASAGRPRRSISRESMRQKREGGRPEAYPQTRTVPTAIVARVVDAGSRERFWSEE